MATQTREDGYRITSDSALIDVDAVHRWLSTESYWAAGRSRATTERAIAGSRCYSVHDGVGAQAAFARVISDGATFAYLCDVFVDAAHRGRGLGSWLVTAVLADADADGVYRVLLATRDAHEVYSRQGFTALHDPAMWMEIDRRLLVGPLGGLAG
jgi:GNAT superfamily N-acetyltransferase